MKLAWIDTEISGPEAYDQVIELGWLTSESKGSYLLKLPEHSEMHPKNEELTGLSKAYLERHGVNDFTLPEALKNRIWCSYSLQHDVNWINLTLKLYGQTPLTQVLGICLAEVYQRALGYNGPIPMQNVLRKIGYSDRIKHRAYDDALMHYHIYKYAMVHYHQLVRDSVRLFNPKSI